jgi:hypothetical protein
MIVAKHSIENFLIENLEVIYWEKRNGYKKLIVR